MNNLRYFAQMLDRRTRAKTGKHGPGPLFKVIVMLNAPDIVVQPSIKDVAKALEDGHVETSSSALRRS